MYTELPPLGQQRPQQVDAQCQQPVRKTGPQGCAFYLRRLVMLTIGVVTSFFSPARKRYSCPVQQPVQERQVSIPGYTPFFAGATIPAPVIVDETGQKKSIEQKRQVMEDLPESRVDVTRAKEQPVAQPPRRVRRPRRKPPVKPAESHAYRQRRKKAERKQRRQEEKRQEFQNRMDTSEPEKTAGPKSHKQRRDERRLSEKLFRSEARRLMAIETETDSDLAQKMLTNELARLNRISVDDHITRVGRTEEELQKRTKAHRLKTARALRISNHDYLMGLGAPEDEYQKQVGELYLRLQTESYGQWQPLIGKEEFQICFAPLIGGDKELDMDAAVEALINFRKLQEIQAVAGVQFPPQAFALLFEDGYLEDDPQSFENVITSAIDLDPEFETIDIHNAYYRKQQYIDTVDSFHAEISERLEAVTQKLGDLLHNDQPEPLSSDKPELLSRQDSAIESRDEPASFEVSEQEVSIRLDQAADKLREFRAGECDLGFDEALSV